MVMTNRNVYDPDTDGRTYVLAHQKNMSNSFVNFDERELSEIIEILFLRRKKTAIKIISLIDTVGKDNPNLFLESIKEKWLH